MYLFFRNNTNFFAATNIIRPKIQPEIIPEIIPAIIAVSVCHHFFTVFMNKNRITEAIVLPSTETDRKKVLNPLLKDFCCNPTNTEAEIMPPLIKRIIIKISNSPRTIPITP